MEITCISDLHGHYPKLEGGDLLIVAGDLTARDTEQEYLEFSKWLDTLCYRKVIVIAGNHDNYLIDCAKSFVRPLFYHPTYVEYLCDSGTEFEYDVEVPHPASTEHVSIDAEVYERRKLKIYGSPWTKRFKGMNPHCMAFTVDTEEELAEKFAMIPHDVDILVTHSPPFGVLDEVQDYMAAKIRSVGSISLKKRIEKILPEMVLFGHVHECGGKHVKKEGILYINGSIVNEKYRIANNGRRIHFDEKMPKMQRFKIIG